MHIIDVCMWIICSALTMTFENENSASTYDDRQREWYQHINQLFSLFSPLMRTTHIDLDFGRAFRISQSNSSWLPWKLAANALFGRRAPHISQQLVQRDVTCETFLALEMRFISYIARSCIYKQHHYLCANSCWWWLVGGQEDLFLDNYINSVQETVGSATLYWALIRSENTVIGKFDFIYK